MRSVERRIQALEARLSSEPVILYFGDGTTQELRGPRYFLLDLLCACGGADLTPRQAEQLELIRQSVDAREPGGARMIEVVRCLLHAQAEVQRSGTQDCC